MFWRPEKGSKSDLILEELIWYFPGTPDLVQSVKRFSGVFVHETGLKKGSKRGFLLRPVLTPFWRSPGNPDLGSHSLYNEDLGSQAS